VLKLSGIRRLFEVTDSMERQLRNAMAGSAYTYLNNMVVRKELRGQGKGTELLRGERERIDRDVPDRPCALSTQREENVVFYERLGFETLDSKDVGQGEKSFRNWVMARNA